MSTTGSPQDRITAFWSMVAPEYEAHPGNVPAIGSAEYDAWIEALAGLLPEPPADVLDLATGSGFVALIAAGLGHRVRAIDASEAMLAEARAAAGRRGMQVEFAIGDAVSPPVEDGSLDAITCRHMVWTLREPTVAFANWRRLLRPGGRVVIIDGFWFSGADAEADTGPFGEYYTPETRAALPIMALSSPEPVADMVRKAGFEDVTISDLAEAHALAENPPADTPWYVITARRAG